MSRLVRVPPVDPGEPWPPEKPVTVARLMVFDRPVGPWREHKADVQRDAILTGNGSIDEKRNAVFITAPAWIAYWNRRDGYAWRG
jgi:hypothetical protein